jgi:hypothetical protein
MVKLPYREEGNPPILRPTVDIRLTCGPTGEWTTRALIDTGSPLTVFDRGVAEALVINIGYAGCEIMGWSAYASADPNIRGFDLPKGYALLPSIGGAEPPRAE